MTDGRVLLAHLLAARMRRAASTAMSKVNASLPQLDSCDRVSVGLVEAFVLVIISDITTVVHHKLLIPKASTRGASGSLRTQGVLRFGVWV